MPWIITPPSARPDASAGAADTAITLPQFDAPFRFGPDGRPVCVQQDSDQEIGAAVYNVLVCEQGAKLADPGFGIEAPLFDQTPLDLAGILNDLRRLEPRAEYSAQDVAAMIEPSSRTVQLQVAPGASGRTDG